MCDIINKSASKSKVMINFQRFDYQQLPQDLDAECEVLGGILLDPGAIARVADILKPEAFYLAQHQNIYRAAIALHEAEKPTELPFVRGWLEDNELLEKIGGECKLVDLVSCVVSSVNVDVLARRLDDKYQRRRLIQSGRGVVELGYDCSKQLTEVLDASEQKIFEVSRALVPSQVEEPIDIVSRIYSRIGQAKQTGINIGLHDLDAYSGGFRPKRYYVIAGRPSMGKTHFGVHVIAELLRRKMPVVVFSAEMDREAFVTRLIAWESGVDSKLLADGAVEKRSDVEAIASVLPAFADCPLWLEDIRGSALTINYMKSAIRAATIKYGKPVLVLLDYLQLLGSGSDNRVAEVGRISRGCREIAFEFDLAFVALAQIGRAAEAGTNKRPSMSHLRESGDIEQDADFIGLLYRDEYYNPDTPDRGVCEINIAKNREGRTGTIKTLINLETSKFLSVARFQK